MFLEEKFVSKKNVTSAEKVCSTVKTHIKEKPFLGDRLTKVLKLRSFKGHFAQTVGGGR